MVLSQHYYAQIDSERVAFAVTQANAPMSSPDLIALESFDESVLGKRHDEATGTWVAPPAPPQQRRVSVLAFRRRFTKAERAAIEWAAVDRAEDTLQQRMQAAALRADLKDQESAQYIDLDDADTVQGVLALEEAGLIDVGRAAQILSAPVEPEERP